MIAHKAWGTYIGRDVVSCEPTIFANRRGEMVLALTRDDRIRFEVSGAIGEWRSVYSKLGEQLAKYPMVCSACSCSPCQCEEQGLRASLFAAKRAYAKALRRAEAASCKAGTDRPRTQEETESDASDELYSREAADTAFGVFARMAHAEGMVALLDGTLREKE